MQLDSKYKHWPILLWLICINLRMFWLFDVILRYHSWQMTTKDCSVYWRPNPQRVTATAWPPAHCLPVFQVTEALRVRRLHLNLHVLSQKIIILIVNQLFWHARTHSRECQEHVEIIGFRIRARQNKPFSPRNRLQFFSLLLNQMDFSLKSRSKCPGWLMVYVHIRWILQVRAWLFLQANLDIKFLLTSVIISYLHVLFPQELAAKSRRNFYLFLLISHRN